MAETVAHEKNNTSAAMVPFTFLKDRESDTIVGASKADITRSTATPPIAANSPHVILVSKTTFHTRLSAFMIVSSSYRCECSDSTICQGYGPELRCKYTTAPCRCQALFPQLLQVPHSLAGGGAYSTPSISPCITSPRISVSLAATHRPGTAPAPWSTTLT